MQSAGRSAPSQQRILPSKKRFNPYLSSTRSSNDSSRIIVPSSEPPAPSRDPYPIAWCPSELVLDSTRLPPLPPLPSARSTQVFLHKSAVGPDPSRNVHYESVSYKPLEFFGDAMVGLQVSRVLMERFPDQGPGFYSFLRGKLVDNRTLGILGWGCGLAPLIQFGPKSPFAGEGGRNCPQGIVSEVFEAYIGALGKDPASNEALSTWFDQVFGEGSPVFPRLDEEASIRIACMAETVRRRTCRKEEKDSALETPLGHMSTSSESSDSSTCDCLSRPKRILFKYVDQNYSGKLDKKSTTWHTVLTRDGEVVSCGVGEKRLDAREDAWSSALGQAMGLI